MTQSAFPPQNLRVHIGVIGWAVGNIFHDKIDGRPDLNFSERLEIVDDERIFGHGQFLIQTDLHFVDHRC